MKTNDQIEPVEIFAGTIWEAELLKSILDNAEIESFLLNEFIGTMAPWYTASGGAGSVKVIVSNADFERAKALIEEFQENLRSNH